MICLVFGTTGTLQNQIRKKKTIYYYCKGSFVENP